LQRPGPAISTMGSADPAGPVPEIRRKTDRRADQASPKKSHGTPARIPRGPEKLPWERQDLEQQRTHKIAMLGAMPLALPPSRTGRRIRPEETEWEIIQ